MCQTPMWRNQKFNRPDGTGKWETILQGVNALPGAACEAQFNRPAGTYP